MGFKLNSSSFDSPLRGQLVVLLHRDYRSRHRLSLELARLGYSVLPLESDAVLRHYLDGAAAYNPRVAYPDALIADELTLGLVGLRRLAALRDTECRLPILLLSDFPLNTVTDEEICAALHVVAVLHRPYTRDQLAAAMARVLPLAYTDEAKRRCS
ncbi:hypothetical protein [Tardiphaga sp.]|uniref:hypothetical protein n=1 Tax=Tardiphaga sp. TaxID=1926292 RepID=UPI002629CFEC|nr:hypothetical protein [Tardiphaga sp.]MDB5617273.1 hypothetical protein [Tardiphaga sp.]